MQKLNDSIKGFLGKLGLAKQNKSNSVYIVGVVVVLILCGILYLNPDLSKNLKTSSFTDIEKQWCKEGGGVWDPVGFGGCDAKN